MNQQGGLEIQCRSKKLFGAFFSKQLSLSAEMIKYEGNVDESCITSAIALLRADSAKLNIPFMVYATQFVVQAVEGLIHAHSCGKEKLVYAISSRLASHGDLNIVDIQKKISEHPIIISPHMIVELNKIGVISFLHYFESCAGSNAKSSTWTDILFGLACNPNNKEEAATLFYLLSAIINIGFGTLATNVQNSNRSEIVKISVSLLNNLTTTIWDYLWESLENEIHIFELPMETLQSSMYFDLTSFQNCYLEQLAYLISYKPEIKACTAIKFQHDWTFFKSPRNVVNLVIQLLIPLEVEKVVSKIEDVLNRYEINWKTLLLIVSTVQVCYPTGTRSLKALINSLAQRALENLTIEMLLGSFLLARQINAENTSSIHYGSWFSSITSSSTTSKQFAFLLKFLSSIARHEPTWVLVAHKNNPPAIPVVDNSRALWTDYTALIRTRLEDMKLKNPVPDQVAEDATLIKEVDAAIAAYGKTGRIPSSVIEAAIFRKPYFINKFLPVLLKPRRVPDAPDVREVFVDELKKSGKLPLAQYDTYVAACRQMDKIPVVENMDWQSRDGEVNYQRIMNQIALCKDSRQQSLLLNKLDGLLVELLPPLDSSVTPVEFIIENRESNAKQTIGIKIAESWIDSLQNSYSVENQLDWLNRCFLFLCRHPMVVESFYYLTWEFTRKHSDNDNTIRSYGILICLLGINSHILQPACYHTFNGDFIKLLMGDDYLSISTEESMLFHLKLLYYTAMEAKRRKELDSVRLPASVYLWLARRMLHSEKSHRYQKYLGLSKDVEFLRETKLSITNWLRLEMIVKADKDVLSWSERSGYLHSIMEMDYPEVPVTEVAPIILDSIVKQFSRNPFGRADCSKDLLLLLQYLINRQQNPSDSSAWLTSYWMKLHREQESNVDQLLWNLVCSLPPYLLSRNSYDQTISENSLKTLTTLIEEYWRNTLTSESAWFPKYVASHLTQALGDTQTLPLIPCLQFSVQIHCMGNVKVSGTWRTLGNALDVFHPLTYDPANAETIDWTGTQEVDLLISQLMALAAVVWCASVDNNQDWPMFIQELGLSVSLNPELLKGWKLSFWMGDECLLPWMKILPTYLFNLLPFVLVKVLISWSDLLLRKDLPTVIDYLEALTTAHIQWIRTTSSFIDSLSGQEDGNQSHYPSGKMLDFATFGRLGRDIKQILNETQIRALKTLQQSPNFRLMEDDLQSLITQRCS